jgi:hypothetical protein
MDPFLYECSRVSREEKFKRKEDERFTAQTYRLQSNSFVERDAVAHRLQQRHGMRYVPHQEQEIESTQGGFF